jgi:hypothetical protein
MRLRHLVTVAATCLAAGCIRQRAVTPAAAAAATLEVRNSYLAPVDVYVQRENGGAEFRVGQVFSDRTARFALDQPTIGGASNVALIAVPVSTQARPTMGRAVSAPLVVRAGDRVRFNITTDLRTSTAFLVR